MFKRINQHPEDSVTITINGLPYDVPAGETVAAAILASSNLKFTRTSFISNSPRAPFCLMGVCYECLMVINGQSNQRACQVQVEDGMIVDRQKGTGLLST